MAGIRAARTQLSRDPAQAETRLAGLQEEAHQALRDLRRVVAGIHPAVLTDHGLATAVRARISRFPIDVEFECPGVLSGQRFGEDVESAAYFLISESLTNVLKHSGSAAALVKLASVNGHLRIEVRDSGRSFNLKDAPVSGLQGIRDRVEALGGRLTVNSSPGAGTSLVATLKIRAASHV
jgi:signal transduction histidine kinase